MRAGWFAVVCAAAVAATSGGVVEQARRSRDTQDTAALQALAARTLAAAAKRPASARVQYEAGLVHSYWAEALAELRDQQGSRRAAEAAIGPAEKAVGLQPGSAEYHRLLGALYGQMIPGNVTVALRYGKRTLEELERALALDPASAPVYLSRGIGKYYLPAMLGGGAEAALADLRKAVELDARSDEAHLWLGLALRKANRNPEARAALERAVQLNPRRAWARQQLEKTPAR